MPPDPAKAAKDNDDAEYELELVAVDDGDKLEGPLAQPKALSGEPRQVPQLVSLEPPRRFKGRLFLLKKNETKKIAPNFVGGSATGRSFNYEEIYEEDAYGEEAFPDARVWKVYNDEAQLFDLERVEAWRDAVDVLLVFIGLFAAVVAAFLIETSKSLQPDYAQVNVMISYAILRSLNDSTPYHSTLHPDLGNPHFGEATKDNSVVNALWYTSLTISLSTALLAMLIKQWLHQYMTSTSGTARERARIRHFRFVGLERYRVPTIIDLLPTLLHLALGLFLAGLALFLRQLNDIMFGLVVGIAAIPYTFYTVSIILALVDAQCPYKSQASFYIYRLYNSLRPLVWVSKRWTIKRWARARKATSHCIQRWKRHIIEYDEVESHRESRPAVEITPKSLDEMEKQAVLRHGNQLDIDGMVYLYQTSSNTNVRDIALEAFCGLTPMDADLNAFHTIINSDLFYFAIYGCKGEWDNAPAAGMERRHDRLIRALSISAGDLEAEPYIIHPHPLYPGETDPRNIFGAWLLPWCAGWRYNYLAGIFTFASQHSFPLSVWGTLIRLAKDREPNDLVIRAILIPTLHLPLDSSEVGVATLGRAMQNPKVRSIGLAYLDLTRVDISISIASITSLLLKENDESLKEAGYTFCSLVSPNYPTTSPIAHLLSSILPSLFKSLANRAWPVDIDREETLRTLLLNFFSSRHLDDMSWQVLSSLLEEVWINVARHSVGTIFTSFTVHGIINQFLYRGHPIEKDVQWIQQTIASFRNILLSCGGDDSVQHVIEAFYSGIQQLDLLPVDIAQREKMTTLSLFWSISMCGTVDWMTCKYYKAWQGLEWFEAWLAYIHVPERLAFLCLLLVSNGAHGQEGDFVLIWQVRPENPSWLTVIETLLLRFNDPVSLESMADQRGNKIQQPRKQLSEGLFAMRKALVQHHPALSQPKYNIPQFDHEDKLIPSFEFSTTSQNAVQDIPPSISMAPQQVAVNLPSSRQLVSSSSGESNFLSPNSSTVNRPRRRSHNYPPLQEHVADRHTSVDVANSVPVNTAGSPLQRLLTS